MIYLDNSEEAQVLFIPRNGDTQTTSLSLKLRNTIGHNFIVDDVLDLNTSNLYFNLSITLPAGVTPGEYEYDLMDGNLVLSTGILIIQESSSASQYNKSTEYEQYQTE